MKNVVKWMMVVMLVSIDILTPFSNAELYDENTTSQINDEIGQEIEISAQEENQQYAGENLQSEEDEEEEENEDIEEKDLLEDKNLGEIGDLDNDLQEEDKNTTEIVKDGYKNELNGSGDGIVENIINEIAENFVKEINIFDNDELVEFSLNPIEITGSKTIDDVTVNVLAPVGSFYSGTDLVIKPVKSKVLSEIKNQLVEEQDEITEDSTVIAFDISFIYSGEEVQPISGTVQVSFNYETNDELKQAEEDSGKEVQVYHINDKDEEGNVTENKEIEKIDIVESSEGEVVVEAESFSIYTIVTQVAEEGPKAETEDQLANFVYGEISIARPDTLSETDYPIEGFTIMDRNLGAITTGAGEGAPVESYGYHYQWGNNYGFNSNIVELSTGNVKREVSGLTGYYSGLFIVTNKSNFNDKRNDTWMISNNTDLWDGDGKQGPCPEGWHIPTNNERIELMIYWAKNNGVNYTQKTDRVDLKSNYSKFSNDFYFPYAGIRDFDASFLNVSVLADYRSRSYKDGTPYSLFITDSEIYSRHNDGFIRGLSVRCFKDNYSGTGNMFKITYDFNGGSGSVVNQMVKSGSLAERPTDPIKSGYNFIGWYISGTDQLFDFSKVINENKELYAKYKYICAEGFVDDGEQCVDQNNVAYLKKGSDFKSELSSLSNGVGNIVAFERASSLPEGDETIGILSLSTSNKEVKARFNGGTIYYYTDADTIFLNSDSSSMFSNFSNLQALDLSNFNTSKVTSMGSMFLRCTSLQELNLSNFNTSNVTDMAQMFNYCNSLSSLNVSGWDTSNVKNMNQLFARTSLSSLDISHFDTSKVTNMAQMFNEDSKLTALDLSHFNTSKVTNMAQMFNKCSSLQELDLSSFDTSSVTNMGQMFSNLSLTALDLSSFNTSSVTNMKSMFYSSRKIESLDLSNFNTSKVTDMSEMFNYCNSLSSLNVSGWDTSKVTNMNNMFARTSLSSLDIRHFDTSSVTNMSQMFNEDSKLTALDLSHFNTSKVTNMAQMFNKCSSLQELDLSSFDTSSVTNMGQMFSYLNLTGLNLRNFDTSNVTNMSSMFYWDKKMESLDLSNFNTSKVTDMSEMFNYCNSLSSLNVSGWDTSKVTNMNNMFARTSLSSLDIRHFDTSSVTNMNQMFQEDKNLTTLDLSSFDTSNVTTMNNMFRDTSNLGTIYVSGEFSTSKVNSSNDMFKNSKKIIGGNGTKYDSSHLDAVYASIDSLNNTGYFTDPNNFTVRYLSGNEVVANLTGKLGGTATGLNDEGRIYSYYSDASKTIPYDFTTTLSGYTEIYVDRIYENEGVTIETNNSEYGTVNDGDITVEYGSTITASGNELTIDGNTIVATPKTSNNQYTYGFNGWANTCGSETNPTYFDEIIYKYEGDYKFDGSNYINTNINLFNAENYQRDFEISFDIVNYNTNTESQGSFISVMNETGNPWPGIVFRRSSKNATTLELVSNGGVGTSIHEYNSSNVQNVKISRKNSKLYLQINNGENIEVYDYTNFNSFFNVPLTIGASLDGNGNPWRYIKATLSNIEVKFTDGIGVTNGETVTGDCTITANFSRVKNSYPVIFKNYDGTILNEKTMEYGTTSQYVGDTPSKQGNVQYNYTFAGWDRQISQVTEPQLYTATYTPELNQYTVTIVSNNINSGTVNPGSVKADYNESIVLSENTVKIGETTVTASPTDSNEQYAYGFSGWNNTCGDTLTGDCTITAEFKSTVNKYLIRFIDGDGNVIQSGMVEYGTVPSYSGDEPTKTRTAQYTYSFSGWDSELEEVTGQKTYTAIFTQTLNKYKIIFVDEDGETILGSGMYVYGTQSGDIIQPISQKPATVEYTYTFAGWAPEIQEVTTGAVYRATYSLTKNKYTITWLDGDGNILKSEQVEYGSIPSYSGTTPSKTATQQYTYTFNNKWTPNIEPVTTGAEYMAQFDSSINSYLATINVLPVGYGTVSSGSITANYGTTINANSNVLLIGNEVVTATPTGNDAQYTYTFSGWNNRCGGILIGNCTITSEFNRTINRYTVIWKDGDGNIIGSGEYEYGVLPEYSGNTPTKTSTDGYNYMFNGQWQPVIQVVTGDIEYLAQFDEEVIKRESSNGQSGAGRRKKDISDNETHGSAEENSSTENIDVLDKPYSNMNTPKDSSSQNLGGETEFEQAYNFAKSNGITTTSSIQKARMNTNITRIQMAKMLSYYAINVLGKMPDTERGMIKFNDITNKMDKEYDNAVTLAYQLGIMGQNVKNNEFRPNDEVTRAEFVTALSRLLYEIDDGKYKGTGKYYVSHMSKLYNEGIITKTDPSIKEKRGYVMIMLMRSAKMLNN